MDNFTLFYWLLPLISFLAFYLKGITGTGTSTVIIVLSSFLVDPKLTVVLASFISVFGNAAMLKIDETYLERRFWVPVAVMMILGSVLGSYALIFLNPDVFRLILGAAFLLVAGRFLFKRQVVRAGSGNKLTATMGDYVAGCFAGFSGGLVGMNAPILIMHFGRFLDKAHLRKLLVYIFLPSATIRTGIYFWNGLFSQELLILCFLMIPTMFLGIYVGNKSFNVVSEDFFRKILAVLMIIAATRLIFTAFS